ncbi:hypothetical protein ACJX0J_035773, partial [Zea mays]
QEFGSVLSIVHGGPLRIEPVDHILVIVMPKHRVKNSTIDAMVLAHIIYIISHLQFEGKKRTVERRLATLENSLKKNITHHVDMANGKSKEGEPSRLGLIYGYMYHLSNMFQPMAIYNQLGGGGGGGQGQAPFNLPNLELTRACRGKFPVPGPYSIVRSTQSATQTAGNVHNNAGETGKSLGTITTTVRRAH